MLISENFQHLNEYSNISLSKVCLERLPLSVMDFKMKKGLVVFSVVK